LIVDEFYDSLVGMNEDEEKSLGTIENVHPK
jgi:hypothetical protein